MRRLGLVLLLLLAPAGVALEVPVADPPWSGMGSFQIPVLAASDGNDFLFVWRSGESRFSGHYAARVTRDGVLPNRELIPLPWGIEHLVWTGSWYLALFNEQTIGGQFNVQAMRLDRDGKSIPWPEGTWRILKKDAIAKRCVTNGRNIVVGYTEYSWTSTLARPRALVLNMEGDAVADHVIGENWRWTYDIAWNGEHFMAVWIAGTGENGSYDDPKYSALARRFSATEVLDPAPRALLDAANAPRQWLILTVESDGRDFLILNSADGGLFARRVSGDLATMSSPRRLPESFPQPQWLTELSQQLKPFWVGSHYLFIARQSGTNVALRLDRDGSVLGSKVIENAPGSTSYDYLVAASNGRDLALAWSGASPGYGCAGADIFATVASASTLDRRFQVLVSTAPADQRSPLVAAGGTNALVVWTSGSAVYARRFLTNATPVDDAPLLLAECSTLQGVSFNGADYLVFLSRPGGFEITRVPREGPLRAQSAASLAGVFVATASHGGVTLLLWYQDGVLSASRLRADGAPLATAPIGQRPNGAVTMAGSSGDFLIVWQQIGDVLYCTDPTDGGPYFGPIPGQCYRTSRIRGTRISPDLVERDPVGFDIAATSPFEFDPTVAWNGHQWLVAWRSAGTPRTKDGKRMPEQIRGRFVAPDGSVDDQPTGVLIANAAISPRIEWDGERYAVGWQTYEKYTSPLRPFSTRIAWLMELGQPLILAKEVVAGERRAAIAVTGRGTAAATYSQRTGDLVTGPMRAFVNVIDASAGAKRRAVR